MSMVVFRIVLIVLSGLVSLAIGLLLRRELVRRLKRTVLDKWLIQTLGVIVVFPPLILAAILAPIIWDTNLFLNLWYDFKAQVHIQDVTSLTWSIIETILITVLGIGTARTIKALAVRGLGENRIDINTRTLIGRIFYIITLSIAVFWVLSVWSISIGVPVAVIGVLTVALTVAVQDILKDLVAGFYILMEHPFRIGDQVSVGSIGSPLNYAGKVEDVQLRATRLRLLSGEEASIPNSLVFGGVVVNNSYYGERRSTVTITLPQEEFAKDETLEKALKAVKEIDAVMTKPEAHIVVNSYVDKQVTMTLRFWIASSQLSTVSEVMYALRATLPNANLVAIEPVGNV
jgi:small-conductance mechanosensitive channel